jgi:hypothetical protein
MAFFTTSSAASGYGHYVLAMVIICTGIGLAMSAATSASMAQLQPAQADVGSAVNDTTRNIPGGCRVPGLLGEEPELAFGAHRALVVRTCVR